MRLRRFLITLTLFVISGILSFVAGYLDTMGLLFVAVVIMMWWTIQFGFVHLIIGLGAYFVTWFGLVYLGSLYVEPSIAKGFFPLVLVGPYIGLGLLLVWMVKTVVRTASRRFGSSSKS